MSTADSPEPRRRIAVSGASGKTGWRVVQEAIGRGLAVRALPLKRQATNKINFARINTVG